MENLTNNTVSNRILANITFNNQVIAKNVNMLNFTDTDELKSYVGWAMQSLVINVATKEALKNKVAKIEYNTNFKNENISKEEKKFKKEVIKFLENEYTSRYVKGENKISVELHPLLIDELEIAIRVVTEKNGSVNKFVPSCKRFEDLKVQKTITTNTASKRLAKLINDNMFDVNHTACCRMRGVIKNQLKEIDNICYTVGSGRRTRIEDNTEVYKTILDRLGISYTLKNKAPRGGKCGNYIVLNTRIKKSKVKQINEEI